MTVTMKCGCRIEVPRDAKSAPLCETHGERIVQSVTGAKPRFTGTCTGPLVEKS